MFVEVMYSLIRIIISIFYYIHLQAPINKIISCTVLKKNNTVLLMVKLFRNIIIKKRLDESNFVFKKLLNVL